MGLWNEAGVPRKGWRCVYVYDTRDGEVYGEEPEYTTCEMCDHYPVRYVHVMEHPEYGRTVEAGCECAEKMEREYAAAKKRDATLKKRATIRKTWLSRGWRLSQRGNPWKKYQRHHLVVFHRGTQWGYSINGNFSDRSFDTEDEAKLKALDAALQSEHPGLQVGP